MAGNQTRLIFHLFYNFKNGNSSVNANTLPKICTVKCKDLDHAVDICIKLLKKYGKNCILFISKSDLKSAFRVIPVLVMYRRWLLMKDQDPITQETFFFIEKCLLFGPCISCAVFQEFSDALDLVIEYLLKPNNISTNYLDDFLFITITREVCNHRMESFLTLCKRINCLVSEEKTE